MDLVVDASVVLSAYFSDERNEYANSVLARLSFESAVVPSIWLFEIANGLRQSERRGRSTQAVSEQIQHSASELPIDVEHTTHTASRAALNLARAQNLTVYDAAYLELAMREGLPLATLDDDLRAAATRVGVTLVP